MPRIDAIDVSVYQGHINWPQVLATPGLTTVAMKATQGLTTDSSFARNRAGARPAQRRFFYHWVSPNPAITAAEQAAYFIRVVGPLLPGEGVLLDCEQAGITASLCADIADLLERHYGRPCAVYCGVYTARSTIWPNARLFNGQRARWLAGYVSEARARALALPYTWDAWQWSSSGTVAGVPGRVDVNQIDDPHALDVCCGLTAAPTAPPAAFDPGARHWGTWPTSVKPTVRQGATGNIVRYLQGVLKAEGLGGTIDGQFGPNTANRVRTFQSRHHCVVDAIVGRQTWAAIDAAARLHQAV